MLLGGSLLTVAQSVFIRGEVASRLFDIGCNLCFQCIDAVEFFLRAKIAQKLQLQLFAVKVAVVIEHMHFGSDVVPFAKSWAADRC